jgi:hypothetical protein
MFAVVLCRDIYTKWNTKLFQETQKAFANGRVDKDPLTGTYYYQGELDFFDQKVIPLAKRIVELSCFGSLGEEFLQNAEENRREWCDKGCEIVKQFLAASEPTKEGKGEVSNDGTLPSLSRPWNRGLDVAGDSLMAESKELDVHQADDSVRDVETFHDQEPLIRNNGAKTPSGDAKSNGSRGKTQSPVSVSRKLKQKDTITWVGEMIDV